METFGKLAFYAGLIIAILVGIMDLGTWVPIALVVLGLLVGLLNITEKESHGFLLATVALVVSGVALSGKFGMPALDKAIAAYVLFTAAAAFIVALMQVWHMQKN